MAGLFPPVVPVVVSAVARSVAREIKWQKRYKERKLIPELRIPNDGDDPWFLGPQPDTSRSCRAMEWTMGQCVARCACLPPSLCWYQLSYTYWWEKHVHAYARLAEGRILDSAVGENWTRDLMIASPATGGSEILKMGNRRHNVSLSFIYRKST